jgi:hypothetical protein
MEMEEKKKLAYRVGAVVFLLLTTLTIGEFFIGAVAPVWWAPLMAIALLKAYLIIKDYMHIGRVFATAEDEVQE